MHTCKSDNTKLGNDDVVDGLPHSMKRTFEKCKILRISRRKVWYKVFCGFSRNFKFHYNFVNIFYPLFYKTLTVLIV